MRIVIAIFLCLAIAIPVWAHDNLVESSMRDLGFKLRKRETAQIDYSNQPYNRYTFYHKLHKTVTVNEYNNGFVEITFEYKSRRKDSPAWHLNTSRAVRRSNLRNTLYRIFVLGEQ